MTRRLFAHHKLLENNYIYDNEEEKNRRSIHYSI